MSIFNGLVGEFFRYDDIYQANQIDQLDEQVDKQTAQNNRNAMSSFELQKQVISLTSQNEQLALMFRTIYDVCLEKGLFCKQEFKTLMDKIDASDGKLDGRLSPPKE